MVSAWSRRSCRAHSFCAYMSDPRAWQTLEAVERIELTLTGVEVLQDSHQHSRRSALVDACLDKIARHIIRHGSQSQIQRRALANIRHEPQPSKIHLCGRAHDQGKDVSTGDLPVTVCVRSLRRSSRDGGEHGKGHVSTGCCVHVSCML